MNLIIVSLALSRTKILIVRTLYFRYFLICGFERLHNVALMMQKHLTKRCLQNRWLFTLYLTKPSQFLQKIAYMLLPSYLELKDKHVTMKVNDINLTLAPYSYLHRLSNHRFNGVLRKMLHQCICRFITSRHNGVTCRNLDE